MSEVLSWDKVIDKDIKSADDKKIGKVRAVTKDFIQVKKGTIDKKYYFVPKYYIQGYDGEDIWLSLYKYEIEQFESEKELPVSNFENERYLERKQMIEKEFPRFSAAIPKYSNLASSSTTTPSQVGMPWDKILGEDVKSADEEALGEVASIGSDWIEVKKGSINKKHYYIPKIYVQEFDGKKLHISLTEDEIEDKFERDTPPTPEEFQTEEYKGLSKDYEVKFPQYRELIPLMAKEPGLEIRGQKSGESLNIPWEEVIHKHVRTSDNTDTGDVDRVGNEFIVVREGVVKVHLYYIPKQYITHYDGSSLWLSVPSGLISGKFERETEPTQQEIDMMVTETE